MLHLSQNSKHPEATTNGCGNNSFVLRVSQGHWGLNLYPLGLGNEEKERWIALIKTLTLNRQNEPRRWLRSDSVNKTNRTTVNALKVSLCNMTFDHELHVIPVLRIRLRWNIVQKLYFHCSLVIIIDASVPCLRFTSHEIT